MTELSPEARALIDKALGAEGLSAAGRGRIRRSVATQLSAGTAASPGAARPTSTAGKVAGGRSFALATATKVFATFAIVGAVGAGGLAVAVHGASYVNPFQRGPVAARPAPSVGPHAMPAVAAPMTLAPPSAAPSASSAALPAAGVATLHPGAITRRSSAPIVSPAASSFEHETRLLRDASLELSARRPDLAMALLDEHARLFSHGALVEERKVERILALCALGRAAEAQAEGAGFMREQPRSLLARRVLASCGPAPAVSDQQ